MEQGGAEEAGQLGSVGLAQIVLFSEPGGHAVHEVFVAVEFMQDLSDVDGDGVAEGVHGGQGFEFVERRGEPVFRIGDVRQVIACGFEEVGAGIRAGGHLEQVSPGRFKIALLKSGVSPLEVEFRALDLAEVAGIQAVERLEGLAPLLAAVLVIAQLPVKLGHPGRFWMAVHEPVDPPHGILVEEVDGTQGGAVLRFDAFKPFRFPGGLVSAQRSMHDRVESGEGSGILGVLEVVEGPGVSGRVVPVGGGDRRSAIEGSRLGSGVKGHAQGEKHGSLGESSRDRNHGVVRGQRENRAPAHPPEATFSELSTPHGGRSFSFRGFGIPSSGFGPGRPLWHCLPGAGIPRIPWLSERPGPLRRR